MTIYAILKLDKIESKIIQEEFSLYEFNIFTRGTIKKIIKAMALEVNQRTHETKLVEVREKLNDSVEIKILTQRRDMERVIIVTDKDYKSIIGQKLVNHAFKTNDFKLLIKEYKNWQDHDLVKKIEEELMKCNMIVVDGLSQIMERGESLSDLMEKSENLSSETKLLFKTAKKKNRCC